MTDAEREVLKQLANSLKFEIAEYLSKGSDIVLWLTKRNAEVILNWLEKTLSPGWTWPKTLRHYKYLSFDVKGNSRAWLEKPNLVHVGNDLVFCGPDYTFVDVEPPPQAVLPALIANPELVEDIP